MYSKALFCGGSGGGSSGGVGSGGGGSGGGGVGSGGGGSGGVGSGGSGGSGGGGGCMFFWFCRASSFPCLDVSISFIRLFAEKSGVRLKHMAGCWAFLKWVLGYVFLFIGVQLDLLI